jgi:hypothetical protein
MVPSIVGHLLQVGNGRRDPASTAVVLAAGDRVAIRSINIAPARGPMLEPVAYPRGPKGPCGAGCDSAPVTASRLAGNGSGGS